MARVERFTSTEPLAVEQAQLIDPSAFRFSTASAEAAKEVGGVLSELGRRRLAAEDSLAINTAGESRDLARLKMKQLMLDNPDPAKWSEGLQKIINEQRKILTGQRFSAEALENEQIEQQAFEDELSERVEIESTARIIENDVFVSGKNLISAIANDDDSPMAAMDIEKQIELYQKALERKFSKDVAALQMEETLLEAENQKTQNAKQAQMDLAAVNPGRITTPDGKGTIDIELKSRGKGKEPSEEFALLSNTDLEAIRDYANSIGQKAKSDSKIAVSAAIEDSYAKIIRGDETQGDTDITAMITAIQADPSISDDDSNIAAVKIRTFFNSWNSTFDEKIVTSDSTRIKALEIESAVLDGFITKDEGLERYLALSKTEKINSTDGKQFINKIFAAGKSAKDVESQRRNSMLSDRTKKLRDAIERQPSLFAPEEVDEVLKDFANVAVIELKDKFRKGEFTKEEVDAETDRLMRKFTLSEGQQLRAINARQARLAETLEAQQKALTKIIASLKAEGKTEEAKELLDESILLGIFESSEEGKIEKKKGKKKARISRGFFNRLREQFK